MAKRTREVTIKESKGTFSITKDTKISKSDYDFSGLSALRKLLSNEKARMIDAIKNQKPKSLYELAKILDRGFKSVVDDIKLLERFGFVELVEEKTKNKTRHKPEVVVDTVNIELKL
ncbi:MAG: hypothetical protein ABEI74_03595 [Candidatus Pacearchaeota archaeon]